MSVDLSAIGLADTIENQIISDTAVDWLQRHTTLTVHEGSLTAAEKLFILKYSQIMSIHAGVSSESISGMSQSFVTGQNLESKIYELAISIFGIECLKSTVTVLSGESKWSYGS